MSGLNRAIRRLFLQSGHRGPKPRPRWRRRIALFILAMLLGGVAGYAYLTSNGRIRELARSRLHELLACPIEIDDAEFSISGRVELRGLRIRSRRPEVAAALLAADAVHIRYRPWELLTGGGFKPLEVTLIRPSQTVEYDVRTHADSITEFLAGLPKPKKPTGKPLELPTVHVRDGQVRVLYTGIAPPVATEPPTAQRSKTLALNMTMFPGQGQLYTVTVREPAHSRRRLIRGKIAINTANGAIEDLSGFLPVEAVAEMLPSKYAEWVRKYSLSGTFLLACPDAPPAGAAAIAVTMEDLRCRLPKDKGELDLGGVVTVHPADQRVSFEKVALRIPQAGARIEVAGRWDGFRADGDFRFAATTTEINIPKRIGWPGVDEVLAEIHRHFSPEGLFASTVTYTRVEAGRPKLLAVIKPQGASGTFDSVPARIDNLQGEIRLTLDGVEAINLTGTRGEGQVLIQGTVGDYSAEPSLDVTVKVRDKRLDDDEELRNALPPEVQQVIADLDPRGPLGVDVRVYAEKGHKELRHDVEVLFDGQTSIRYAHFAYPLDKLTGSARATNDHVTIDGVNCVRGQMRCTVDGRIEALDANRPEIRMTVNVAKMPLDETLIEALGDKGGALLKSLHPTGMIEKAVVKLHQASDQSLTYNADIALKDSSVKADAFPYAVTGVSGNLSVTEEQVDIHGLQGRHGGATITAVGKIPLDAEPGHPQLKVSARDVLLDNELRDALPEGLRKVWERFSPGGLADVSLRLGSEKAPKNDRLDYRLVMDARNAEMKYEGFPLALSGITGRVTAAPGRVDLKGLSVSRGKMNILLDGSVVFGPKGSEADLSIKARALPVDEALIAAISAAAPKLGEYLGPGGIVDADLSNLRILVPSPSSTRPATAPAPAPTAWTLGSGRPNAKPFAVVLNDVRINTGQESQELTGKLTGSAAAEGDDVEIDAALALEKVRIGKQLLTNLAGDITKKRGDDQIRIRDIEADIYGGQLRALAVVQLADPVKYGVDIRVFDVDLGKLVNAGIDEPQQRSGIKGLLRSSHIWLKATVGKPEKRSGEGILKITGATITKPPKPSGLLRVFQLPVLLQLVRMVQLSLPGKADFPDVDIAYSLEGHTVTFREVHLRGAALSLVGSGTMNLKTDEIDLTFLGGPSEKLPSIEGLLSTAADQLLKAVAGELLEVRASGTLSKPRTRVVPVPRLDAIRKRLMELGGWGE